MRIIPKRDKLNFGHLQYNYICIYASYTYAAVN